MSRIDHVAVESPDPEATAAFYEHVFGARIVKAEGHPVMAYMGATALAVHEPGGPGAHTAVRVSAAEQARLRTTLDELGVKWKEHDHGIALGLFFRDPDGRLIEAITYRAADDPRRPPTA